MPRLNRVSLWMVALVMCLAPLAFADGPVNLTLINGGPYTMDGVYVGPYNFTENNQPVQLICDDFKDDVYAGESWTANVTSFSSMNNNASGLMFAGQSSGSMSLLGVAGNSVQGYEAMAYLAGQMLSLSGNPQNATQVGYLAYAIWAIFEGANVKSYLGNSGIWSTVEALAAGALQYVENPGNHVTTASFAGWELVTPVCNPGVQCPQEYLQFIGVPEGGSALLYLLLAGVSCFGAMRFRLRRPVAVRMN